MELNAGQMCARFQQRNALRRTTALGVGPAVAPYRVRQAVPLVKATGQRHADSQSNGTRPNAANPIKRHRLGVPVLRSAIAYA